MTEEIGSYLKQLKLKIQNDPKNHLFLTLQAAMEAELVGNKREALKLYLRCGNEKFAKERVHVLSPLKFIPVSEPLSADNKPKLTRLLSTQEEALLKALNKLRQNRRTLTRDALRKLTGFSKELVFSIIESLQNKGYLSKLQRRYRHINVVKQPIKQNGCVGSFVEPEVDVLRQAPKTLIFSPQTRRLYRVDLAPKDAVLRPEPNHTPTKFKI